MGTRAQLVLIGDHDPESTAHRGITVSIETLQSQGWPIAATWVAPRDLGTLSVLSGVNGIWCAPGSPYSDSAAALRSIGYARGNHIPFLGTCGGFQHAILEYARTVLGLSAAGHEELEPGAAELVVSRLSCSMVEASGQIALSPASKTAALAGALRIDEQFHCNFGLNPTFAAAFDGSPLRFVGHDDEGDVRVFELQDHPFFAGTLFQPERAVLTGRGVHPLIYGFAAAVVAHGQRP